MPTIIARSQPREQEVGERARERPPAARDSRGGRRRESRSASIAAMRALHRLRVGDRRDLVVARRRRRASRRRSRGSAGVESGRAIRRHDRRVDRRGRGRLDHRARLPSRRPGARAGVASPSSFGSIWSATPRGPSCASTSRSARVLRALRRVGLRACRRARARRTARRLPVHRERHVAAHRQPADHRSSSSGVHEASTSAA